MALTTAVHDSLPYIDKVPTASERAAAQALIDGEILPTDHLSHLSLAQISPHHLSPLIKAEHLRLQNKQPLNSIDLTRYEAIDPPSTDPDFDEKHPETLQRWRAALARAYTSHSYLTARQKNLALLEEFGRNAWLIGNSQLEGVLRELERELNERKTEIDQLALERRSAQEAVGGEINVLEDAWKRGVGAVLKTEVAAEGLRRDLLERRRMGARE
jgi:pre-mRNA-splicing factor SPF27